MVSDSKILTVSYGTFSCTLEGFDDPFSTMRSIAEYFRDLAADDRYFGAEPPTPDAQMLHSIAEKEIKRRVEAKIQDNGVVLRQLDGKEEKGPATSPDIATGSAAVAQPADYDSLSTTDEMAPKKKRKKAKKAAAKASRSAEKAHKDRKQATAQTAPKEAKPQLVAEPAPVEALGANASIADKLARIRAAVAQRSAADYVEDQISSDDFEAADAAPAQQDDYGEESDASETPAVNAGLAAAFALEPDAAEATGLTAVTDITEVEIVVEMDTDNDVSDEEAHEDTAAVSDTALHDIDPTLAADIAEATRQPDVTADAEEMALIATKAQESAEPAEEDSIRRVQARVIKMRRSDFEAEEELWDTTPEVAATDDAEIVSQGADVLSSEPDMSTDSDDQAGDVLARISALSREPLETADADALGGDYEPTDEAMDETVDASGEESGEDADLTEVLRRELGDSSLDADAEDELMRELAEVAATAEPVAEQPPQVAADLDDTGLEDADLEEAELEGAESLRDAFDTEYEDDAYDESIATETEGEDAKIETNERDVDSIFAFADEDGEDFDEELPYEDGDTGNVFDVSDDSMGRLLDTTERKMEDGEHTRRHNAIQHLKAAVQATRAEEEDGTKAVKDEGEDQDPYREDLARVVRPSRPSDKGEPTVRRLAPLMLVSEQRIDVPKERAPSGNITPVRPRRISSAALAVQEEEEFAIDVEGEPTLVVQDAADFAEYVETVGADGLADVLEAAAAFAKHVQGCETVNRPHIMRLANQALPKDYPLEERLRSFGQLLRQGKIRKVKRGQFEVDESTRFKPK